MGKLWQTPSRLAKIWFGLILRKQDGAGRVAVVIPCFNEERTIGAIVAECVNHGDVFLIDDGSTDNSAAISRSMGANVVPTGGGRRYEGVIEIGLRHVYDLGYDFIVTIDADGEHDPRHLAEFVSAYTTGAPLVLGIRAAPQRLAEWLVCIYCRIRFGIYDVLCGYKGYSRSVLEGYFRDRQSNLINTRPALQWIANAGTFEQFKITGEIRADAPRFGSRLRANIQIAAMILEIHKISRT